ncbi:threonine--tRNA ligase [Candidatus Woesearchaeota archaeon CG07_land_8_20_14_0_80_44_23]|nr:MAG: threonine--tRNA ligase [Candidatus Woesearchaeota archaeon CG07_land_8_20_14_0_80_44_23]
MAKITFPDGSAREYTDGISAAEIAKSIGIRDVIAAKIDGQLSDLTTTLSGNAKIIFLKFDSDEGKEIFRHSAAHLLAQAVKRIFPEALLAIGPAVEEGFYYDIDHEPFKPEDIAKIEAEMKKIVSENLKIEREEIPKKKALELFKGNPYKLEMIRELPEDKISIYKQGEFFDLCRGPHVPSTGILKAVKITKIAGAYWHADAKNKQLQRIYGIAFPEKKMLDEYLKMLEEAEQRDHRKIGKELDLFSFHEEGPGFPFFHSKGMIIMNELIDFWREEHRKAGYLEIKTPIILSKSLWEQSGHWDHYKENMYFTKIDNREFAVKPMNCPGGMLVYKTQPRSYKDFPMKVAELGLVHRHELSGVLSGLFRVRCFTQDDAHIYVTEEQVEKEVENVIKLIDRFYKKFGFEYHVELSTRPENAMGEVSLWEKAEANLRKALEDLKMPYKVNEGQGAFYGPKIDFHIKDCLGRTWQCGTVQLDFQMPIKFDLWYDGQDGKKHRPAMLHRVIYGSMERFLGILIEHYAGKFPLWLSPVQIRILTVADRHDEYAQGLNKQMEDAGLRVEVDSKAQTIAYKVRDAQLQRIPLILTVGDREVEGKTVSVRTLDGKVKFNVDPEKLLKAVCKNVAAREREFELSKQQNSTNL